MSRFPFDFTELGHGLGCETARLPGLLLLAIPLLPNLQVLDIEIRHTQTHPFELLQQLHAHGVVEPFWRIKDLTLQFFMGWTLTGDPTRRLTPLLALTPKLNTLRLCSCPGFDVTDQGVIQAVRKRMPQASTRSRCATATSRTASSTFC